MSVLGIQLGAKVLNLTCLEYLWLSGVCPTSWWQSGLLLSPCSFITPTCLWQSAVWPSCYLPSWTFCLSPTALPAWKRGERFAPRTFHNCPLKGEKCWDPELRTGRACTQYFRLCVQNGGEKGKPKFLITCEVLNHGTDKRLQPEEVAGCSTVIWNHLWKGIFHGLLQLLLSP